MTGRAWLLAVMGVAAGPCAASKPATSAPPPAAEKVVGPPEAAWQDMTRVQRGRYMKAVVLPAMKELFVGFDPKAFANFNCGTCHGPGVDDGSYKMPNPAIFV